eukprot:gene5030-3591_t
MATGETILTFKDVCFEYAPLKPLLANANFTIKEGSKVTIMGQNGAGKSTILKLINQTLFPTSGSIHLRNRLAVSTAMQTIPPEDREKTVYQFFLKHVHGAESGLSGRISNVLQQVDLPDIAHDRLIKSFSGGQQARLLLASALILSPDILLLDEPTNNLDVRGIEMLREFILTSTKTCVVISHDEDFLNSFSDSVLYLDSNFKKVEYYDGNYHDVKREIANRIERENQENARLLREAQQKKAQASSFANKGGSIRKVAKKLREDAEELESSKVAVRREDRALKPFAIPFQSAESTPGLNSIPLRMMQVTSLHLPGDKVLDLEEFPISLEREARIQIKGTNGVGKTTCLENLVHRHKALGCATLEPKMRIGYYRQDFHNLNFQHTVVEALMKAGEGRHDMQFIRQVASMLLLTGDIAKQKIVTLSEGQKGLLSLACLILQEPAILVMDEPTNHINFRHLPAIAKALQTFKGAVMFVSHDTDFVKKVKPTRVIDLNYELKLLEEAEVA